MSITWAVTNDEGVVGGPFYNYPDALDALLEAAEGEEDHGLTIEHADNYDEHGDHIEEGLA